MEALGRLLNVVPVANGASISLKQAQGVTFVVYGAAEAFTLTSSVTAAGAQTNLAVIDNYYLSTSNAGAAAWTDASQAAAATISVPAAGDAIAFEVGADELPAGANYVRVTHTTAGLVIAIVHDLHVQRDPKNLPALAV